MKYLTEPEVRSLIAAALADFREEIAKAAGMCRQTVFHPRPDGGGVITEQCPDGMAEFAERIRNPKGGSR